MWDEKPEEKPVSQPIPVAPTPPVAPPPPQAPQSPQNNGVAKRMPDKKTILMGVGAILVIGVAAAAMYFFFQYQNAQRILGTETTLLDEAAQKKEVENLVKTIGKLAVLPGGETPTVATISDKNKLAGQEFFEKAENGDKVLIYAGAKVAVIYRPSLNKIINLATNITTTTASPTEAPSQPEDEIQVTPEVTVTPTQRPATRILQVTPVEEPTTTPTEPTPIQ